MTDKKLISSLQGLRAVAFLKRGPVPLRRTVAGAVGNFRICGAVRFSDDLQLLRPPAHSTWTAVCHGLFPAKNTQAVSAAPYYDGCCPAPCAEGAPGAALCPWGAVLCSAACVKHFSPANLDSLQPFLVLSERSSVVSFGAGFSVCNLSLAARRAEKGRYSQTTLHCCRDFLRTMLFLLCNLEGRTQWKGCILPDLSVSSFPGRRFCHQLLYGLPLPQPQGGAHTLRCLFPSGAGSCAVFGRLLFHRCQTGGSFRRGSLPVQRAVHPLCGAAGLAARRGQGSDFPAAFRKAVFVAGRVVALRLSDPSGTDPVYGVGCKQAWSYGTTCGLDPDRIFTHALPEQLLQGIGAPGAEASYKSCRTVSLWLSSVNVNGLYPPPFSECIHFIFPLISAHAFCTCRVCVKCAQTQISRLKNLFFNFPPAGGFALHTAHPRMSSHCYKKYAAFLPRKWLKTAYLCIEDVI